MSQATHITRWAIMQGGNAHEPFDQPAYTTFHDSEAGARAELAEWVADLGEDANGVGIVRIEAAVTQIAKVDDDVVTNERAMQLPGWATQATITQVSDDVWFLTLTGDPSGSGTSRVVSAYGTTPATAMDAATEVAEGWRSFGLRRDGAPIMAPEGEGRER